MRAAAARVVERAAVLEAGWEAADLVEAAKEVAREGAMAVARVAARAAARVAVKEAARVVVTEAVARAAGAQVAVKVVA